jgi:hypothetical protein
MPSLDEIKGSIVGQVKRHREYRLASVIRVEYPAASGKFLSCSAASQNNWAKLSALDSRGLVAYPFKITTFDEKDSFDLANTADLSGAMGAVADAVLTERATAAIVFAAVLGSATNAAVFAAAEAYLTG